MGAFGWSLPPGVTSLPGDEPCICEVCNQTDDTCACPECPECGEFGDPKCYEQHGLVRTPQQIQLHDEAEKRWEEDAKADAEFWEGHKSHLEETLED